MASSNNNIINNNNNSNHHHLPIIMMGHTNPNSIQSQPQQQQPLLQATPSAHSLLDTTTTSPLFGFYQQQSSLPTTSQLQPSQSSHQQDQLFASFLLNHYLLLQQQREMHQQQQSQQNELSPNQLQQQAMINNMMLMMSMMNPIPNVISPSPNLPILDSQHYSQPPILQSVSSSSNTFVTNNNNNTLSSLQNGTSSDVPTTAISIPEPLYELYIKPILMSLQNCGLYSGSNQPQQQQQKLQETQQHENQLTSSSDHISNSGLLLSPVNMTSSDNQQQNELTITSPISFSVDDSNLRADHNNNQSMSEMNNVISQQALLESLLLEEGLASVVELLEDQSNINNNTNCNISNCDKDEEKKQEAHKHYDPKLNKKGLKKKRKYIKSGLYKKDKDGNFLFSSGDRARLAQINNPSNKQSEGELGHNEDFGPNEHQGFYMEDENSLIGSIESKNSGASSSGGEIGFGLSGSSSLMNSSQQIQSDKSMNRCGSFHDLLGIEDNFDGNEKHEFSNGAAASSSNSGIGAVNPFASPTQPNDEQLQQLGFERYFSDQLLHIENGDGMSGEETSQLKILVWAQWQLLSDAEKKKYIDLSLNGDMTETSYIASSQPQQSQLPIRRDSKNSMDDTTTTGSNMLLYPQPNATIASTLSNNNYNSKKRPSVNEYEDNDNGEHQDNASKRADLSNRVKKPISGYNSFVKSVFPTFQEQYPDVDKKQITKLIGQKWKSMSEEEKKPYLEIAKQAQPIVKKPLNAYNIYCKEKYSQFKAENPTLPPNEVSRMVAQSWKNASKQEKQTYFEMADQWKKDHGMQETSAANGHEGSSTDDLKPKTKKKKT